jgi:hypothetical protein
MLLLLLLLTILSPHLKKVNATKDTLRTPGQQALLSNVAVFYLL